MICVLIFVSLSGCEGHNVESSNQISAPGVTVGSPSELNEFVMPEWFTDYDSILEEYRRFVDYSIEGGARNVFDNNIFGTPDNNLGYQWDCMKVETNIWSYRDFPMTKEAFGYALKDLNGNGSPELILLLSDYTVLAVFSMAGSEPKLLDAFWPKHRCAIFDSGLLYIESSGGASDWDYTISQVSQDDSELFLVMKYGHSSNDGYYMVSNGEKHTISESEFRRFQEEYPILFYTVANEITADSGLELIPLFD